MNAWTEARVESLKAFWAGGLSATQISGQLDGAFTRSAILGKINRLGLEGRRVAARQPHHRDLTREQKAARQEQRRQTNGDRAAAIWVMKPQTPKRKPTKSKIVPAAPGEFLGIPLINLEDRQCRFPRGEGADITFCGQPTPKEQSWCLSCHRIVYAPPLPRRDNSPAPARFASSGALRVFGT